MLHIYILKHQNYFEKFKNKAYFFLLKMGKIALLINVEKYFNCYILLHYF